MNKPRSLWWCRSRFTPFIRCPSHLNACLCTASGECTQFRCRRTRFWKNKNISALNGIRSHSQHTSTTQIPDNGVVTESCECEAIGVFLPRTGVSDACVDPCNCFSTASVIEDSCKYSSMSVTISLRGASRR